MCTAREYLRLWSFGFFACASFCFSRTAHANCTWEQVEMDYWHAKNCVRAPARERANGPESSAAIPELNFAAILSGLGTTFSSHKATKCQICIVNRTYFRPALRKEDFLTEAVRDFMRGEWGAGFITVVPQRSGATRRSGSPRRTSLSTRSMNQWYMSRRTSNYLVCHSAC